MPGEILPGPGETLPGEILIDRCIKRQEGAFDSLVTQCSPAVKATITNVLLRYSNRAATNDVEDLHNGVFLALMEDDFRRLRQFQGRSSLITYIKVIASRYVLDYLRKQKKHVTVDSDDVFVPLEGKEPLPDQQIESAEQKDRVRKIIKSLPPSEQLLLKFVYDRHLKPTEVCKIMGISMYAYYNKKSRVIKKMQMMYEKLEIGSS